MKAYENDTRIKIPNWYRFVPGVVVNAFIKVFEYGDKIRSKKRRKMSLDNKQNIKFYV